MNLQLTKMKTFLELAKSRRSVRQYGPEEISHEQIEKIIEAGIWAPSAINKQPIKFFVLQNPNKIKLASEKIIAIKNKAGLDIWRTELADPIFYEAPIVIFLCTSGSKNKYSLVDASFVCQNCLLQAKDMELATVTVGQADLLEKEPTIKKELGFPDNWKILIAFCLGKTKNFPPAPERKKAEIIFN